MLNAMRKNLKKLSWVLWLVIAAFIGTIFAVWGIGGGGGGGRADQDIVAWIDEKPVTSREFYETRQRLRKWYQQIYGERFGEFEERLQLSDSALSQLIQVEAQTKASQELGISISDEQIKRSILEMPEFQEDGRFSRSHYARLLAYNHIDETTFIKQMRTDMARKKVQQLLCDAIWISDPELKSLYRLDNEKIRLEYLQINSRTYAEKIKTTDSKINKYFDENADKYQIPDKVSLRLLTIDPEITKADENLQSQLEVSEEDIEDYYYENDTDFSSEKEVRARHILFKSDGSDAAKDAEARKKAEGILVSLKDGEDFIELARKHSEDTSASKGGDLGFFPRRGRMVEPFANASFSLGKGEISDIVKTKYGYHIIRVDDIKEAGIKDIDEVRMEIKTIILDQKALKLAEKKAERIRDRYTPGEEDIDALAKRFNLDVQDTELFAEREIIPTLGWMPELAKVAFYLEPDEISPLVQEKNQYYLFVLKERVQAHQAKLEEVRDQVKNDLIEHLSLQKAQQKMKTLQQKIKASDSWDSLADGELVKLGDTGLFSRKEPIKGIGKEEKLAQEVFQKKVGDIIGPKEIRQMVYILRVVEKQAPDWNTFAEEKETLRQQQLKKYGNKYYKQLAGTEKKQDGSRQKPGFL